jgi:amino acid transporter
VRRAGGAVSAPARAGGSRRLRRELRFWEAIALSIGIMAPTAAMALNGTVPASLVGQAVPLVFLLATIAVGFVAYAFIRMARHFSHAGSVYAFTGATLGPQAGFFAGWALLGTYLCFTAASAAETGLFGAAFLDGTGIWKDAEWLILALVAAALVALVAYGDIKAVTRGLLGIEGISVTLIVILMIVIFAKLAGGSAPRDQSFTLDVFTAGGVSVATLASAAVFGFLSFAGFEGAASLGEETNEPHRHIPRAIAGAVLVCGAFYVVCMMAQSLGFGIDKAGIDSFASSGSPLGDLGAGYISSGFGDAINFGATISAFASSLGTATAGSRILFAMGRDGFITRKLGEPSPRTGAPAGALAVVVTIAVVAVIAMRANNTSVVNAFFYPGTIGVLSLLVAYVMANIGGIVLFVRSSTERAWEIVIPIIAIAILGYVFWKNVTNQPYPFDRFPLLVGAWAVVGFGIVLLVPGLARRIGANLVAEEGMEPQDVELGL